MENAPYSQIQKGTFLIATPEIDSGIFFRAVVLVCEHNPNGSFGIIVNKSLELELPEEIININNLANPHVGIRAGGPVQTNQMMLLHTSNRIPSQTLQICDNVFLGGDLQFLQETISDEQGPHIHLCFGYAGWGAGQLEREFLDSHWFLHPASAHHLFDTPPEKLWQALLRDMGGKYASLSMIPEDLTVN
ncbi:YqgE/AlgH family protein [Parachlamydia acanthamoebae]|uniref:YqgE/AlgH family protein n=1 Tax=Parachlamydia acanthamoebae TaxID=83552 RepID=UPI0007518324|nr:YqgE/AlgH family protein [Parachlamydia acanthamoebae]